MALKPKEPDALGRPFLQQLMRSSEDRVEGERKVRGLKSRAETVRQLVDEGLFRANRLRGQGKSIDLPSEKAK